MSHVESLYQQYGAATAVDLMAALGVTYSEGAYVAKGMSFSSFDDAVWFAHSNKLPRAGATPYCPAGGGTAAAARRAMKHLFVFSPIVIYLGIVPVWFYGHGGVAWLKVAGKAYLAVGIPYSFLSPLVVAYLFVTGRWVSRVESGIALAIIAALALGSYAVLQDLRGIAGG